MWNSNEFPSPNWELFQPKLISSYTLREYILLMKKLILWVMCITLVTLVGCQSAKAQEIKREGKTFIAEKSNGVSTSKDVATSFTWKDVKGNEYPIFLHKYTKGEKLGRWGAYVIKTSQKTGKEYKSYLKEEVSNEIVKEMGL